MRLETLGSLSDVRLAGERIAEIVAGSSLEAMRADWKTQAVLERLFEILGEALVRIRRTEPVVFERIPDATRIVGLRNFLTHVYEQVDLPQLWSAAERDVPELLAWISAEFPELQ